MKKCLGVVCLSLLGAALATGCGSTAQAAESQGQAIGGSGGSEEPFSSIAPQKDDSGLGQEESGSVQTQTVGQCCHVKCANGTWYGPFTGVRYNSCPEYGKYYCPAYKHGSYANYTWAGC